MLPFKRIVFLLVVVNRVILLDLWSSVPSFTEFSALRRNKNTRYNQRLEIDQSKCEKTVAKKKGKKKKPQKSQAMPLRSKENGLIKEKPELQWNAVKLSKTQ